MGDAAEQQCTVDLRTSTLLFAPGLIAGPQVTNTGYLRQGLVHTRALPHRSPGHVQIGTRPYVSNKSLCEAADSRESWPLTQSGSRKGPG